MSYPRYGPMLFLTVLVMAIMALPPLSFASTTDESLAGRIDAYVADQMNASSIPGVAVSISQSGEIIHAKGYGHTSGDESPVTPQTLLGIGSTGKSITALAIMQLVEVGMIELDTSVQTYIPRFSLADRETSEQITVRHLLNMTSGIPATAGGEAFRSTLFP